MSLYNISNKNLTALTPTTFAAEGLQERHDLYPSYLKLQRCWLRSFTPIT
ncbi:membrane protein [Vibrio cholerae]|nr:membrane protein [Vibrio cholerae]